MKTVADPRVINLSSEIITETRAGETEVSSWSPLLSYNLDIDIGAYYISPFPFLKHLLGAFTLYTLL